jgi:4-amino-4-deoxy-L-arabinose transferase-like glycosyltransferase
VLIFFTTMSLYAFWLGLHEPGSGRHWMWGFYVGMALATLTKGPVGFLVPPLAAGLYLTATRRWTVFWHRGFPLAGTLVFLVFAGPWYAAMFLIHGDAYGTQAKVHTVGRFLAPMEGHGAGPWFYFAVVLLGFFPWSLLLPASFYQTYHSWRERRRGGGTNSAPADSQGTPQSENELEWFAALWLIGTFVFFTLSSTRLPHYIGPLFPAASLLTALYWSRAVQNPSTPWIRGSIHAMTGVGYLLAIGFACLPSLFGQFAGKMVKEFPVAVQFELGIGPYVAAAVILIAMGLISYFGLNEERRGLAFGIAGAAVITVFLLALLTVIPGLNRYAIAPPQELAYAAGLNLEPSDQFIAFGTVRPSMTFYSRRKVVFVPHNEIPRLRKALTHPGRTMILLPEAMRDKLPPETASFQPVLARYGYLLLASQPIVTIPEPSQQPVPSKPFGH